MRSKVLVEGLNEKGLGTSGRKRVMKAYPGDEVTVTRQGKRHHVKEILGFGEHRAETKCVHFRECNACIWQAMKYVSQLRFKQERVEELFGENVGRIEPSPKRWNYRNKMELVFLGGKLGYRAFGKWYSAFDLEECELAMEWMHHAVENTREAWKTSEISEYDLETMEGMLRYLVLKGTRRERMTSIVATSDLEKRKRGNSWPM